MKKYHISYILIFCCCLSPIDDNQKNTISKNTMKNILKDIIIMESIKKNYGSRIDHKKIFGDKYIFEKYGVNDSLIKKSQDYYAQNPKIYTEIYESVLMDMERMVDSIEVLVKIQEFNDSQRKLFLNSLKVLVSGNR